MTVRVVAVDTDISLEHLAEAEAQATKVYEAVGVDLHWVHEGQEAEPLAPGTYPVSVVLLSGRKARHVIALEHIEDGVFGYAAGGSRRAYIFCDRIITTAGRHMTNYVDVLGYVIAHELGHLVLPPNSHSSTGIMRADMELLTHRLAYFTATQGGIIRGFLSAASQSDASKIASIGAAETMR